MPRPNTQPDPLADLGALMGPIVHETSNFLNALLLNVAVLESSLPAEARADLDDIRRQGAKLGAIMRMVQQRQRSGVARETMNLNDVVRTVSVPCTLASEPLVVAGPADELDRLVRFLMNATSTRSVTTRRSDESAVLEMDCGVDIARHIESRTLDPQFEHALEIAACQAIVRRRGGALRADNGVAVVTLPLASTNDGRG